MGTKKGPSWANDPSVPQPSIPITTASPLEPSARPDVADEDVQMDEESASAAEPISDADWLKQRMSTNVDKVVVKKAFEQSDDEEDPKEDSKMVCLSSFASFDLLTHLCRML